MNELDTKLTIRGSSVSLPIFFPSISSIKTNLAPLDYLKILVALEYPYFLISAYDLFHSNANDKSKIVKLLKTARKQNQIVLLDSGNYESYWSKNNLWTEPKFKQALKLGVFSITFCYDEQNPINSITSNVKIIEKRFLSAQKVSKNESVIPIVHSNLSTLKEIVYKVGKRLQPLMLAVPERLLGDGIIMRAETLFNIRKSLSTLDYYIPIHLLGTGNPLSILIYSICGADSFDGLEWCQTAIDYNSAKLLHFQQREFSEKQSTFDNIPHLPYTYKTLAHNLAFYNNWMTEIQQKKSEFTLYKMLKQYLSDKFCKKLYSAIPEVKER